MQIDTALRRLDQDPELARHHMDLARAMVRSSLSEVRRSIWILRTRSSGQTPGVVGALSENLAQLGGAGVVPSFTVAGRERALEPEIEHGLLRIAHEAVTNALRHAEALTITVDLTFQDDAVDLRVRDDGRGFDAGTPLDHSSGNHFGLVGILERAHAMGGELRLSSRPGEGTEIACRLPYRCRMVDPFEGMVGDAPEEEASS